MNQNDEQIQSLLKSYKKLTVIGMSLDKTKPSYDVPLLMAKQGFDVVGVNPSGGTSDDFKIYRALAEVPPEYRKFVNVFRRPDHIPAVVDEILQVGGVEVLWLQLGISHSEAEKKAENFGIKVISNRCLKIEFFRGDLIKEI